MFGLSRFVGAVDVQPHWQKMLLQMDKESHLRLYDFDHLLDYLQAAASAAELQNSMNR